jgi:HAD superfamily hydrolase (TIGR01509 family)
MPDRARFALLFDVDGTIAETEELHRQAFNRAFADFGLVESWSVQTYRRLLRVTGGKERIAAGLRESGRDPAPEAIAHIHARKTELYTESVRAGAVALRPGVQRLLRGAAARGVTLGLATTTTAANVEALLAPHFGRQWRDLFGVIVAGDQVPRKKPAPDVYLAALSALEAGTGEAIAIEDSQAGVRSARAAGLAAVATRSLYCADDDLSEAVCVLPDLGEPESPWAQRHPAFENGWVDFDDLRRLAAAGRSRSAA